MLDVWTLTVIVLIYKGKGSKEHVEILEVKVCQVFQLRYMEK